MNRNKMCLEIMVKTVLGAATIIHNVSKMCDSFLVPGSKETFVLN